MTESWPGEHAARMDRIYRYERHLYDPLRRIYLLGRDRLIDRLAADPASRILEVGCGTARNLIELHRRRPEALLYGLDVSAEMLKTARAKLRRRGLARSVELRQGLVEELDHRGFGLEEPFGAIFFSYSLSMMPVWRQALDVALANLRAGGRLYAVDFWDQAPWPSWLRAPLRAALARYHVHPRPEMLAYLDRLEAAGQGHLDVEPILGRYAFFAVFRRPE